MTTNVRGRARLVVLASGIGMLAAAAVPVAHGAPTQTAGTEIVLSGENNRLNAYDAATGEKHTVIPSAADAPGTGLDINAEICPIPDGLAWKTDGEIWFIAGEDTEQNAEPGVIKQGWGIFRLNGDTLTELSATQIGKFVPESFVTEGDNPENFGCGILPDGRVVTGDVGDQLPNEPATGQLIVWFIDSSHIGDPVGPDRNDFAPIPHCKIDVTIGTAGGMEIDGTDVLIASNRPDLAGVQPGGILRYDSTIWPTGPTPGEGCGRTDSTGAPLADEDKVGKSLFIPQGVAGTVTPSDIVHSGRDTFYVSSVFTGQVAEYDASGILLGYPVFTTGQLGGITPFGITMTSDGALWIADIGIQGPGPAAGEGSIVRVADPQAPGGGTLETIDEGLEFPDGLGVVTIGADATPPVTGTQRDPDNEIVTESAPTTGGATGTLAATGASTPLLLVGTAMVIGALGLSRRRQL